MKVAEINYLCVESEDELNRIIQDSWGGKLFREDWHVDSQAGRA